MGEGPCRSENSMLKGKGVLCMLRGTGNSSDITGEKECSRMLVSGKVSGSNVICVCWNALGECRLISPVLPWPTETAILTFYNIFD